MKKSFSAVLDKFNSDLWHYHLVVPRDISDFYNDANVKRLKCVINDVETFQCALMPKGANEYFININKERRKKLNLQVGDQVAVELAVDESPYGLPMPDELGELLKIDDEANDLFHALTPGKQRNLLFIVGKPKTSDTRLTKALIIVNYLKRTGGTLDFRALNEAFKKGL
jgi:hypothetical protein